MYNFNEIINRCTTDSCKYCDKDKLEKGIIPLWVADMDFLSPVEVKNALLERVSHGIYGYGIIHDEYYKAVSNWFSKHYHLNIDTKKLMLTPGVVFAISVIIKALTKENDKVIILEPVYYPFKSTTLNNKRQIVISDLVLKEGKYEIDFTDFEKKIIENDVKLFILCNPHNPVGRVWDKEDLLKLGNICLKHNVFVVSDEIHADFVYNKEHVSFASISKEFEMNSAVCTAPSKTFNLPGLQVSNTYIGNEEALKKCQDVLTSLGFHGPNILGVVACEAAYTYGEKWLEEVKEYIYDNIQFVDKYLKDHIPEIELIKPEGTYLVWIDCKKLHLSNEELEDFILNKAKLWLDGGIMFGKAGEGYQRINVACPRSTLEKALNQLKEAVDNLKVKTF